MSELRKIIDTQINKAKLSGTEANDDDERIDAILKAITVELHDSIMRHELNWPSIREDAWLNATIHRWIDNTLEGKV